MIRIPKPTETRDRPPDTTDADVFVLGGEAVGAAVARRFQEDGRAVALIDESSGVSTLGAGSIDLQGLTDAGLEDASTVIVATSSDSRNLLAAQVIRSRFDVERVLVVANRPDRVEALAAAGHETVCATTALADAIVDHA